MSGTSIGGIKARNKNLEKDPDFYKKIGARGGRASGTGGFAANPYKARLAGMIGGKKSGASRNKRRWFATLLVEDKEVKTYVIYADDYREAAQKASKKFIDKGYSPVNAQLKIVKGKVQ